MAILVEMIDENYGGDASYKEIVEICISTITLFNSLEGEDVELKRIVSCLFRSNVNKIINLVRL